MIPAQFEYLTLMFFFAVLLISMFEGKIKLLLSSPQYWLGLALFSVLCVIVETIALQLRWWTFSPDKIIGLSILGIPVEEYMIFAGFYTIVMATWKNRRNELA